MRLLFDQNLSIKLCAALQDVFPECDHVGLLGLSQASDHEVWRFARQQRLTIVSQDADFRDLVMLLGPPPKVIWLRAGNQPTRIIADLLTTHADQIRAFDLDVDAACLEIYGPP